MIVKKRTKPLRLEVSEAILRRLHPNHHKFPEVKEEYARRKVGYQGEQRVDYQLEQVSANDCFILHDFAFRMGSIFFKWILYCLLSDLQSSLK